MPRAEIPGVKSVLTTVPPRLPAARGLFGEGTRSLPFQRGLRTCLLRERVPFRVLRGVTGSY